MISKNTEKLFRKLQSKKYRKQLHQFIAEGPKVVADILDQGLKPIHLISDADYWVGLGAEKVDTNTLKLLSQLDAPNNVLGIFEQPVKSYEQAVINSVVLDGINDPGNLGTILRTCDWFGIKKVYCTPGTSDIYNAKCVQSTMGSIARVEVYYAENEVILKAIQENDIFVADMEGHNIFNLKVDKPNFTLVMGSESHGPSEFWKKNAQKITIPKKGDSSIESLNVAQASAIIMSQLA